MFKPRRLSLLSNVERVYAVRLPMRRQAGQILWLMAWATLTLADAPSPAISIIIDDLGYQLDAGRRIVALPGPLACSILPYTPYAAVVAEAAYRAGKEVMLHLPMEATERGIPNRGELRQAMNRTELASLVRENLALIPHVRGVNNHRGSQLTKQTAAMAEVMAEIKRQGNLLFVDSRTTAATVALDAARSAGLPATRRDVFLDNTAQIAVIRMQFARLVALARLQGTAVGIAHPRPATIQVLTDFLARLPVLGVRLQSITAIIARRSTEPDAQHVNPYGPLPGIKKIFDLYDKK